MTGIRCALLLAFALSAASAAHAKPLVTKWFPFELQGGHIVVPVEIAGVPARAIFDTGAALHMLDRRFAVAHAIPFSSADAIEVQAGHSRERLPLARGVPVELFGASVKLKAVPVTEVPYADLVIGTGVLSSFVLQIDYVNAQIRFLSHDAANLAESKNLEMRKGGSNALPGVRATIDGEDVWLMLDTGYQGPLILNASVARDRNWPEDSGTLSVDALGTVSGMERRRVPLLQLGPYDLRGVVAEIPSDGRLPTALMAASEGRVRLSGVLGAEVLRHFLVTIDLKHTRIHLAPAQQRTVDSWESSVSTDEPATDAAEEVSP